MLFRVVKTPSPAKHMLGPSSICVVIAIVVGLPASGHSAQSVDSQRVIRCTCHCARLARAGTPWKCPCARASEELLGHGVFATSDGASMAFDGGMAATALCPHGTPWKRPCTRAPEELLFIAL